MGQGASRNDESGDGSQRHVRVRATDNEVQEAQEMLKDAAEDSEDGFACLEELVDAVRHGHAADVLVAVGAVGVLVEMVLDAEKMNLLRTLVGAAGGAFPKRKVLALRALIQIARYPRLRACMAIHACKRACVQVCACACAYTHACYRRTRRWLRASGPRVHSRDLRETPAGDSRGRIRGPGCAVRQRFCKG